MQYFTKNDGEPMTGQERRDRYPDGRCALCDARAGWIGGADVDEGEITYFTQCNNCGCCYPEDE